MTLFPEIFSLTMEIGVIGRAVKNKIVDLECHQIRDFSKDKHRRVDDYPFGGGEGMIMMAEPIFQTFEHIKITRQKTPYLIMMSPKGKVLDQEIINRIRNMKDIAILCGRYEGIDQRLIDEIVDEEISIGNYVLTGGELPALVFLDTIIRTLPGVLSSEKSFENESHYNNTLEHPQYTRPRIWHNKKVPEVLFSGNHKEIENWKKQNSFKY
ncbi:MAG: tRNA (guanosine(37)-N1)-methyltransferase TrmD [Clostridia bacterium]|nr:tRNA (guanosine(37)-N1)-methyltransferase TrmD [Clostridia bacterium]